MAERRTTERKSALIAIVLSLVCTGLGQLYLDRVRRGVTLFLCSLAFAPCVLLLAQFEPTQPALIAMIGVVLAAVAIYFFSVVDAWRLARRDLPADASRVRWGAVYALFIVVGAFYPVASTWLLRAEVLEVFRVAGKSMAPTLVESDRIVVNKHAYRTRSPRRGDVVAFRAPGKAGRVWIKRVIGLPGDRVAIVDGRITVNGRPLAGTDGTDDAPSIEEVGGRRYSIYRSTPESASAPVEVPPGSCFVLGDNRGHSSDSRRFGSIPLTDVVGEAQYIIYPEGGWKRFGVCRAEE